MKSADSQPGPYMINYQKPKMHLSDQVSHLDYQSAEAEALDGRLASYFPVQDLAKNPPKYKTELCKTYSQTGHCPYYYKCQYAHGVEELNNGENRRKSYRTKRCKSFWEKGVCTYGRRCQFSHYEVVPETRHFLKLYHELLTSREEGMCYHSRLVSNLINLFQSSGQFQNQ